MQIHACMQVEEPAFLILAALFAIYNLHSLLEYCRIGLSIRTWWNNQRMGRIITMTAWFFGFLNVILKLLGLFEAVFEVTQKNQSSAPGDDNHKDLVDSHSMSPQFLFQPLLLCWCTWWQWLKPC